MATFQNRTQKEKPEFAPIISHPDGVCELFIVHVLATSRNKIDTLKLQVAEKDRRKSVHRVWPSNLPSR